ncbi:hypothetical protein QTO34_006243 [Cnephaeus nilssonii]|uniref:Reverse transcriptase domain-containing protein n=1 Tax=Cnephaeus nilssonii TaxID=3371016 RepID=A0AA40LIF5_CNENI|nr:hypothetical protein QTO34_006243 [Eptesicus nilssonii]
MGPGRETILQTTEQGDPIGLTHNTLQIPPCCLKGTPNPPAVPNPHTILSLIPSNTSHFTVLDLKDAFFTIPLHLDAQMLFAVTWTDPTTHQSGQITWTVLPQGFRDFPHVSGQALASNLSSLDLRPSALIQYVDDLLLASPSCELSHSHTITLLSFLAEKDIGQDVISFLGLAGYWIPHFSVFAHPLYQAMREPLDPTMNINPHFRKLQQALITAPALTLPGITKPFKLYTSKREDMAAVG